MLDEKVLGIIFLKY